MPTELEVARRVLARGLRQLADEAERGVLPVERLSAIDALLAPARAPAPTPAQAVAQRRRRRKRPTAAPTPTPAGPAAELVEQLLARHGSPAVLRDRFGISATSVSRWRAGGACSAGALSRLRSALAAEPTGGGAPGAAGAFPGA